MWRHGLKRESARIPRDIDFGEQIEHEVLKQSV